jgi:UDP-N-acetylmuramoyl-L-alanyl-D-glutamate--2,6-diaminopimelate ligase
VTTLGAEVAGETVAYDGSMRAFLAVTERAVECGVGVLAVETTSRALAAGFASRWRPDVAVFTNFSQDHLDRHGTPEAYLAAKARLFLALKKGGVAVLNAADPACGLLAEAIPSHVSLRGFVARGRGVGAIPVELAIEHLTADREGTTLRFAASALGEALSFELRLSIPGVFQADNALAAALAADALGASAEAIREGIASFRGVPGRFEAIAHAPLVLVDYAHTPDALTRTLEAARALVAAEAGRVLCVFGCGGERDATKRAPMGAVADSLADRVYLTTDNPRSEPPDVIAKMVEAGATGRSSWQTEPDRAAAIARAIGDASPADAVVIAGRGHETVQILPTGPLDFSDAEVARAACRLAGIATTRP